MRAAVQAVLADPEHRFGNNLDKNSGNSENEALDNFLQRQFKITQEDKDTSANEFPTLSFHNFPSLWASVF